MVQRGLTAYGGDKGGCGTALKQEWPLYTGLVEQVALAGRIEHGIEVGDNELRLAITIACWEQRLCSENVSNR